MAISSERGKAAFRKMERQLHRVSSTLSPEAIHGFRTSTRRLQTLLEEILPERNRNQKKLLRLLNPIRKRAGKVRDIDVQLSALRSLKSPQEPRRKTQLIQRLIDIRAKHEKKLRKLLNSKEVHEIAKRIRRAAKDADLKAATDPLIAARKISQSVSIASPPSEEALHQYRLVVKRARYAAEFAPPSPEAQEFIHQLKKLQDALGHWRDWVLLTHTAADHFGEVNQSSLVAALNNVTRGKFRQAISVLPGAVIVQNRKPESAHQPQHAKSAA